MARRLLLGTVLVAISAGVLLMVWSPWSRSPAGSARRACELMRDFHLEVVRNVSGDRALHTLREAQNVARDAAMHDVRWVPLSSGIDAVAVAFEHDDPGAARVGIEVVSSNCEIAATPLTTRTR